MSGEAGVLRIARVFDAPRERVFAAWTEPEHLTRWWGPGEFRTVAAEADVRPGGTYRMVIEAPGAPRMELRGTYHVVEPPERLVYSWTWHSGWIDPSEMIVEVRFIARGALTEVILEQRGIGVDGGTASYGAGWQSGLDKLRAYLEEEPSDAVG